LVVVVSMVVALMGTTGSAAATPSTSPTPSADEVVLTLFHGDGCPHCAAEIAFLRDELAPEFPDVEMRAYEVWGNEANRALMLSAGERYGFDPRGVPVTVVEGPEGHEVFVGFGAATGRSIRAAVQRVQTGGARERGQAQPDAGESVVDVPLLGEVDLAGSSLLVATLVIGLVDGVNPCSFWVLSVLLAIVLHSGSRGRVLLVGTAFLTVTAGMYAVYVAGAYSVLTVVDQMAWIRLVVSVVALAFGLLQLKDGLAIEAGPSLSISPERRPALYRRMRSVGLGDTGVLATVAGTVVLAVGVSLLETPCTAGLPLLWASLLAEQSVPTASAVALFGVYMAVFLLDELAVFAVAVLTLRSLKVSQRHGQALKVLAGSLLVTLAVAMVALPEAMATVSGTLAVFGAAVVIGAALLLVSSCGQARSHRKNSVPSSAAASEASDSPTSGSGERPDTMRPASPPASVGTTVAQSSSSSRAATRSPSSAGPPSQSS
jgi:cytochrome c biogenesis protein CcdA